MRAASLIVTACIETAQLLVFPTLQRLGHNAIIRPLEYTTCGLEALSAYHGQATFPDALRVEVIDIPSSRWRMCARKQWICKAVQARQHAKTIRDMRTAHVEHEACPKTAFHYSRRMDTET